MVMISKYIIDLLRNRLIHIYREKIWSLKYIKIWWKSIIKKTVEN